jgi:hypothetical protein
MNGLVRLILLIALLGFIVFVCNTLIPMPAAFVTVIDVLALIGLVFLVLHYLLGAANSVSGPRWP